jgi:DNA-binding transcriptional ArsR family regulator
MSALSPEGLALSMSNERKEPYDLPSRLEKALESEDFGPQLKRALGHRRRLEIFIFLMDRPDEEGTGERELADVFVMGAGLVEYHLKVLQDVDLVANVAEKRGLGTAEPSYVAPTPHWLASSDGI